MICSFLLPSRNSPNGLIRSIESIYATARNPSRVEVLIRLDDDDEPLSNSHKLRYAQISPNIHADIGPRGHGYGSLRAFVMVMAAKAKGDWLCMWNDDAVMLAEPGATPWDEQLAKLPTSGVIVQPGTYRLNESLYPNCERSAFPFFPNKSWEQFGLDFWPDAADYQADEVLRVQNGWRTHYLKGITVWHDRREDRWK